MFYYNLLTPRIQRLVTSPLPAVAENNESCSTQDMFKGVFEEEMLHKLGQKIDANGIVKVSVPYKDRCLGKESVSYIKHYFTKPFAINKIFDSQARRKIKVILESRSIKESAKAKGKLDKLEQFLKLPILAEEHDVLLKGTVQLSRLFALFLIKAKQKHLNLKGGMARHLLLPWVLQSLQKRLDPSLTLSSQRKHILNGNRPDWDFFIHTLNPELFSENYQMIYEEIAKSLFGNVDPDFLPYYALIVEKVICRGGEHHTGSDLNANISFGDGAKNRVDVTQHQIIRSTQLFELHGLDISIDIKALQRWSKHSSDEKVSQQDLEEVLVNTDRTAEDDGLQASLDLAYGVLHSKQLVTQDKQLFARFIYWVTHHSRYYEPQLRLVALHTLINYHKTGVAKQIADQILTCYSNHGMNQHRSLQAMWVNTLIALQEELGNEGENLCRELLSYALPHAHSQSDKTVFDHVVFSPHSTKETLQALTLFAFIKALGANQGESTQVYMTRDLNRLQIIDDFSCLVQFHPDRVTDSIENLPLENYALLYDRLLAGTRFDKTCFSPINLCSSIDWIKIEKSAYRFLQDPSPFKQRFGYTLLLACHAAHESFASYRTLVKYFPQVMMNCPKDQRVTLKCNFESAIQHSIFNESFQECFTGIEMETLEDEHLLQQQLAIAMAPWDFKQAVDHWQHVKDSLVATERVELGRRLIAKIRDASPHSALAIFMNIHDCLSYEEERELFISVLLSCYSPVGTAFKWNEVPSLQSALLHLLRRPDPEVTVERRKTHGKKKAISPAVHQESSLLLRAKKPLSRLILCCLELSPDDDVLELFALAAKKNLIENSSHLYDCFEIILKHPKGQKSSMIKLWLLCKHHQIDLPSEVNQTVGLKICEDLFEEKDPACVEIVNQLLPILWNQESNERCVELLIRRLDQHAIADEVSDVLNLINTYHHLLAPNVAITYRKFLFSRYLEQGDYHRAFAQLLTLGDEGHSELESFMEVLRDKLSTSLGSEQKNIRLFFEELIALCLTRYPRFTASQLGNFLILCGKLLDFPAWNNEPPSKGIREKIRTELPAVLEDAEKHSLYLELKTLLVALHYRQMLPPCPDRIVIKTCQALLKDSGKEHIEQVYHILAFYKLLQLTATPGHAELLVEMISLMLQGQNQDLKNNLKLFDRILNCLDYSVRTKTPVISPELFYQSVDYFKDTREVDAERLLLAVDQDSAFSGTPHFRAAYRLLSNRPTHLERSSRILIARKTDFLISGKLEAEKIVVDIIELIIKTPSPESLKNAITCIFEYNLHQEGALTERLLTAVASQPDPALLDHAWLAFDRYYKTSTEWVFIGRVLHRLVCLISEKRHGRLDELMTRFPEFYDFSLRATLNPLDMAHFKDFKAFLVANYPNYIEEILSLNFDQFPQIVEGRPLMLTAQDQLTLPVCLAYARYLETTDSRAMFVLANSLFKEIMVGYIDRSMDPANPSLVKESKEASALFRIATCVNLTTTRFQLRFTMLNKKHLDMIDHRILNGMIAYEMEEQIIAYLELCVLHKQHNVNEVQRLLIYVIEKAKNNPHVFQKLFQEICNIAKRFSNINVFLLIASLLEQKNLSIFTSAFDLFDDHIKKNSCDDAEKTYSKLIQQLLQKILLTERINQVNDLLHTNRLNPWITEESKAVLWATLYARQFAAMIEKGNYQALASTILHLVAKKDVLKSSESALQLAFEDAVHCLFTETTMITQVSDHPRMHQNYLRISLRHFREKVLKLLINLTHCEGLSISPTEDNELKEKTEDNSPVLKKIVTRPETVSHQLLRDQVLMQYPFFNSRSTLKFQNQEDKDIFFLLNKALIKYLSRTDSSCALHARQLMHFQTAQFEYLMENFPERHAEIVKLLNRAVFTCQHLEFEYSQRLNLYKVIKFLLSPEDMLKTYHGLIYQKLIYLLNKPFTYADFDEKFFQHASVIRSLLHSGVHRMIQRGMEMLNEIPPHLITDDNISEIFGLFREMLTLFASQSDTLIPMPAYVSESNPSDKVKTLNDFFLEILSKSPVFSAANPNRTHTILHYGAVMANTYLVLCSQVRVQLGPVINYSTIDLYEAFYTLLTKGFFIGNEAMYLDLIPILKDEIIKSVNNSDNTVTYNTKLRLLNLVNLLNVVKYWGPLENKVVTILQGYLTDLITITLNRCDHPAGAYVWEQFVAMSAQLRLETEYPAIYRILMKKFEPILNPKKQSLAIN